VEPPQTHIIREGIEHVDFARVHAWLSSSYWTPGIPRERIERATQHSALVLSAFSADGAQIGFLRVVSDKTRFAYLCDVWVDEPHRGRGLARALTRHAMNHPEFATVTTWTLATKDAQSLYAPLGFRDIREDGAHPNTWMVHRRPPTAPAS
jgi:ribosomal protein S18 acetylase RimI-like enzyme